MVLAFAMALAGVNPAEFGGLIRKLTPRHKLLGANERPVSPSSRSESSGIGTLAPSLRSSDNGSPWITPISSRTPSVRSTDTPSMSPVSSRPGSPSDEMMKNEEETVVPLPEEPKKRSFLDLAANLRDPTWQIVHPKLPLHDFQSYLCNRSVYFRSDDEIPLEQYPMRCCKDCQFTEPSPYLFGDPYIPKYKRPKDSVSLH